MAHEAPSGAFFIGRSATEPDRHDDPTETDMSEMMTGAEMVIRALQDQGVEHLFGYPGGAVLPIYDALFHQERVKHILVRHEQGAVHAAEGYARSSGKVGVGARDLGPRRHQRRHRARPTR